MTEPNLPVSRKRERDLVRLGKRYCGSNDPGPDRVGCPSDEVLRSLAFRTTTPSLSRVPVSHVVDCAKCYPRYLELRRKAIWITTGRYVALGLGALAVTVIAVWVATGPHFRRETPSISGPIAKPRQGPPVSDSKEEPAAATRSESPILSPSKPTVIPEVTRVSLDLRSLSSQRSDNPEVSPIPRVVAERGRTYIVTLLPVGSPPGPYEFAILNADGTPGQIGTSTASVEKGVTRFVARMNLAKQRRGNYRLGIRSKGGDQWLEGALTIR